MKNRTTVKHGMLDDLKAYLIRTGWNIEPTKGAYEVLRARKLGRATPLLVYNRDSNGCGYSIDERDMPVYKVWLEDRKKRGLPLSDTPAEMQGYWKGELK